MFFDTITKSKKSNWLLLFLFLLLYFEVFFFWFRVSNVTFVLFCLLSVTCTCFLVFLFACCKSVEVIIACCPIRSNATSCSSLLQLTRAKDHATEMLWSLKQSKFSVFEPPTMILCKKIFSTFDWYRRVFLWNMPLAAKRDSVQ